MSDIDIDYRAFIEEQFLVLSKKQEPVPFVLNPVQDKYHNILTERYPGMEGIREITLKARQQGMSSYILALFTVDFLIKPHSRSLCISHSQDSTEALFRKVKFYIQSFCEHNGIDPKILLSTDNREMLVNKTNDAQFRIMTAGSKVGARGDTVTNILFSETAFYPDVEKISAREMVEGTIQQVEQDHGMIFIESTANGFGNYYQEMWEMASKGESIYHATFFGWQEFYTKEWIEKKRKSFLDEKMFNQEFPATPEDAFISTGDQFFNAETLQEYADNIIKTPIKTGELAADGEFI